MSEHQELFNEMKLIIRLFSLSMKSLCVVDAFGTDKAFASEFRKLRDDTRSDAIVYIKNVLPVCTKFVECLKDYFEKYEKLSFDKWNSSLQAIRDETKKYEENGKAVLEMHKDLLIPLKQRELEANNLIQKFEALQMEYEKRASILKETAKKQRKWALWLALIPYAKPYLLALSDQNIVQALAKDEHVFINECAVIIVAETLIPAIKEFIECLEKANAFLEVTERELNVFLKYLDSNDLEERKERFYQKMQSQSRDMIGPCEEFCSTLSSIEADFLSFLNEGMDITNI
ncbi:uncharacterized protein LOC124450893 isoform X2 [Xenia sp. Carnegie-2017]|uniref:uncharacterized protein LOC124450893 isoform X2 n=1 Tax=Xenia sp. Carnegie-2017 TaxID=2897299 RepID=UPI001F03E4CA|nr:uncharacterized protein LOC124450893 isoform X2 [Xenia sp. Carnegie-2017]